MKASQSTMNDGFRLGAADIEQFARLGYAGPFEACSPEEMGAFRDQLEQVLQGRVLGKVDIPKELRASVHKYFWKHWHLYSKTVHELVSRPQIVDRISSLLGDDVLLWKTVFFKKNPNSSRSLLPYHQGAAYFPSELSPCLVVSCLIAIDPQTATNGRIELVPGCHDVVYPHRSPSFDTVFPGEIDPTIRVQNMAASEHDRPVYFPRPDEFEPLGFDLKPGQFLLFSEMTPHRSGPNLSDQRRLGVTARFTIPACRVTNDPLTRNLGLLPVAGCERPDPVNKYAEPPLADDPPTLTALRKLYDAG